MSVSVRSYRNVPLWALVTTTDGALPLAKRRLGDAVAALADPVPLWADGVGRWTPSVYTALRGSLRGSKTGRGGILRSAPCRIETLTLCVEIDTTVAGWEPGKTTLDRLHQHAARSFRPQDCALIDVHCGRIKRWVLTAAELLTAEPRVYLHARCPRCAAADAYYPDGAGERVRTRALRSQRPFADAWRAGRLGVRTGSTGWRLCWVARRYRRETRPRRGGYERNRPPQQGVLEPVLMAS
jgi:hypothetical protein